MITALTTQVFPKATDALLMFWTSSSRNAAPRKKKVPMGTLPAAEYLLQFETPLAVQNHADHQHGQQVEQHGNTAVLEVDVRPVVGSNFSRSR